MGIIKKFKGGSLSETYLMQNSTLKFVRKQCSTDVSREFGFNRLYSQYDRLVKYNERFPGLFPEVINAGWYNKTFYYDMKYYENMIPLPVYIEKAEIEDIIYMFEEIIYNCKYKLWTKIRTMHPSLFYLYTQEKIIRKLKFARAVNDDMRRILDYKTIILNGQEIPQYHIMLHNILHKLEQICIPVHQNLVHGNLTVENIICNNKKEFKLLDPYVENIIDSDLIELSQLFQSLHSQYEYMKEGNIVVNNNEIILEQKNHPRFEALCYILTQYILKEQIDIHAILFYESTQFIRMLPFKALNNDKKIVMYYARAVELLYKVYEELK